MQANTYGDDNIHQILSLYGDSSARYNLFILRCR